MPPPRRDLDREDGALLEMAKDGDAEAFGELVRRHQKRVWLVCRQYLGPDGADGATQDSFLKAFQALASFDGRAAFSTWVTRIAINTCLDSIRRHKRQGQRVTTGPEEDGTTALDTVVDDQAGPERRSIQRQAVQRLARLERELPERQREIFRLRFYAELELDDIATALGVHVGTVKTQLHRVVHRLRQELGAHR
jgi:RNA polymerase sigma-70 factor (ECF subfamily)